MCEGITDKVYKVLCKLESVHWFCKKCNAGAVKALRSMGKVIDRVKEVEERLMALQDESRKEIGDIRQAIGNIETKMKGEVVQFKDVMKQQL